MIYWGNKKIIATKQPQIRNDTRKREKERNTLLTIHKRIFGNDKNDFFFANYKKSLEYFGIQQQQWKRKKTSDTDRNVRQAEQKVHHKFYSHLHFKLGNFSGYTKTHCSYEETGYQNKIRSTAISFFCCYSWSRDFVLLIYRLAHMRYGGYIWRFFGNLRMNPFANTEFMQICKFWMKEKT